MAKKVFGKTWWGNVWVEAMERIDYDTNRLPRGRMYANNGSVKEIKIEKGEVLAKVQGRRPRPYSIKINLKKFNQDQTKTLKSIILEEPAIISELTLGKLPQELLESLNKHHIHLLPTRWRDIEATCSCPDWANPCKHLAAVYYIIANEIDKDPFIILNLRGTSQEALIAEIGLSAPDIGEKDWHSDKFVPYQEVAIQDKLPLSLDEIDLSFEGFKIDSISLLLPDSPLFYSEGNFKKILLQAYKNVNSGIKSLSIIENGLPFKDIHLCLYLSKGQPTFFIYPYKEPIEGIEAGTTTMSIPMVINHGLKMKKITGGVIQTDSILDLFLRLPLETALERSSPSARFLNLSTSIALSLASSASFVPEITREKGDSFGVRYIPLSHSEGLSKNIAYLASLLPKNFIYRATDKVVLTGEDGVMYILSMILTHIVHRFSKIEEEERLIDTFFKGEIYTPRRFEEKQTAKAISDWLERLYVRKKDVSPLIKIEPFEHAWDRFKLQIEVENKKDPLAPTLPLYKIFDSDEPVFSYPVNLVRTDVFKQITLASEYMPPLREILNNKGKKASIINSVDMAGFMADGQGALDLLGIKVVIPKELRKIASPILVLKAGLKAKGGALSYLSLEGMLNFSWEIALGETTISKDEFLKLIESAKGIVRFRDQYLMLKPEEVKDILDRLNRPIRPLSSMEVLAASLGGEIEETRFVADEAIKRIIEDLARVEDISLPSTLNAQLRPYQERGFRWLYSNATKGLGACMADDMGLGKTIQVITLILKLKEEKRLNSAGLIVCPTTVIGNWEKECRRFAPTLATSIYHGQERDLDTSNLDLLITSYGILRRDIELFKDRDWSIVVIDEAQNIKNPETDQTKAVKSLNSSIHIAMSGTPVENRLTELWSIFDFINKGYLGYMKNFIQRYAIPIEKYRNRQAIERLRRITAPFILRRLKIDKSIIDDLPEKIISDEYCYLTKEQVAIYEQIVEQTMKEIETSEGIKRRGLVFKLITSLKQICNHPVHYTKKGRVTKQASGKAERVVSLLEKIISVGEKTLVFTQYKEMGELLVDIFKREFKEEILFFHGGVPRNKREKMIEEFQGEEGCPIMVISLKAGGTGLNLTAATNVIHYDLWWNPAVEAQATDRTYRIGQKRSVFVHRFITLGTFEEKIDEMIKAKRELAELIVTTGEEWITELSNRELRELFKLAENV